MKIFLISLDRKKEKKEKDLCMCIKMWSIIKIIKQLIFMLIHLY